MNINQRIYIWSQCFCTCFILYVNQTNMFNYTSNIIHVLHNFCTSIISKFHNVCIVDFIQYLSTYCNYKQIDSLKADNFLDVTLSIRLGFNPTPRKTNSLTMDALLSNSWIHMNGGLWHMHNNVTEWIPY